MDGLKAPLIPAMLEILSMGGKDKSVTLTTNSLANRMGKSQQAASKHLSELENLKLIERTKVAGKTKVRITNSGINLLMEIYRDLKGSLEELIPVIEINGELFSGLGEGAYYITLQGYKKQFHERLGFDPYPGTLNLRINSPIDKRFRRDLERYKGIYIKGFQNQERTYGGAWCFKATVNDSVECAVIIIERTHYDEAVLEIISPTYIRSKINCKDGDVIKVRAFIPEGK